MTFIIVTLLAVFKLVAFFLQAAAVTNSAEEKLALGPLSSKLKLSTWAIWLPCVEFWLECSLGACLKKVQNEKTTKKVSSKIHHQLTSNIVQHHPNPFKNVQHTTIHLRQSNTILYHAPPIKNRFKTIHQSQTPSKNVLNRPTASTTVQPRNTVRQQQPTTSFICMTIQAHTVLQKLCLGIKITTQGNYVTLIIICHEHQNKLKYILWIVYW